MTTLTLDNLNNLIKERIETFKVENNVVSSYNNEQQTMGDYNGRQILELLQNADDAGAENISFMLDKNESKLEFYNDGVSFSLEGITSIMIANNSSKVTSSYIGNKGLGFRSILNWAYSISICSAGLQIDFSRQVLEDYLRSDLQCLNSRLDTIREKRNFSSNCIPIPILGLPRVSEKSCVGFDDKKGCLLVIKYNKDKEADIISQINAIDDQTLLFLQHIKKVTVQVIPDMNVSKDISSKKDEWCIYDEEAVLEEKYQDVNKREKKKYIVKIAIPKKGLLEGTTPLYNYLPSKESVHLPLLLHATVELNSSRNYVNQSDVNDFILQRAACLIQVAAKNKLEESKDNTDWTAYRMMTPTINQSDYGSLKPLYDKLDELKGEMAICPTVDNHYVKASEYCYYNEGSSKFWNDDFKGEKSVISKILKPAADITRVEKRKMENFSESVSMLSKNLLDDINVRVSLIRHLYDNRDAYFNNQSKIKVLTDFNNDTIDDIAYIQDHGDDDLTQGLPKWVDLHIVQKELVKELINNFKSEIEKTREKKKQEGLQGVSDIRCLVYILECFIDISYFDKTGIANRVVSRANMKLDKATTDDKRALIVEMLNFIYKIGTEAQMKDVRLLNGNGDVEKADMLMLPTELNKQIFGGIDIQYVLDYEGWSKIGVNLPKDQFEEFMKRLGVNRLLETKSFRDVFYQSGYYNFLRSHGFISGSIVCNANNLYKGSESIKICVIRDSIIDKLKKICLQKILQFISSKENEDVLMRLKETIELQFFYNRHWKREITPYNYIRFQLSELEKVKWNIFNDDLILGDVDLESLGSNAHDVINLIRTELRFESIDDICTMLNTCPDKFKHGKNIRKLYKLLIDGLENSPKRINKDVPLFASDVDGNKGYHSSKEVFYTDNTCLPKEVIKNTGLYRLDYPSRQGGAKITNILGLKELKDLNFELKDDVQESSLNSDFMHFFEKLKPYFLLYSIQNVSRQDVKSNIASCIKGCRIILVSKCVYSMGNREIVLKPKEFINVKNDYILNVDGLSTIDEMRASTSYCNAIAEILGMVFKLEAKNEHFIHVFQGFDFIKKYIDENSKDEIAECFSLLGVSPMEMKFWKKYCQIINQPIDNYGSISNPSKFYVDLGFDEKEVKKVNFSQWNNKESIDFLKDVLEKLNQDKRILDAVDLSAWHKINFERIRTQYSNAFVDVLWRILNDDNDDEKKSKFFLIQDKYTQLECEEWGNEIKEDTDYLKCLNSKVKELFDDNSLSSIDVDLSIVKPEVHSVLYPDLVRTIQEDKDFEENRWWLYFDGNRDKIKNYKSGLLNEEYEDAQKLGNESLVVAGEFSEKDISFFHSSMSFKQRYPRRTGTHTTKSDRYKVKLGEAAEKRVDIFLRQQERNGICKYGEWVSKNDDSAGYDFTYILDNQQRYLEVKASSDNTFILSANEYAVAMNNIDLYDIAIVNGNQVTVYKSFFKSKGETSLLPKDYYVNFSVK